MKIKSKQILFPKIFLMKEEKKMKFDEIKLKSVTC